MISEKSDFLFTPAISRGNLYPTQFIILNNRPKDSFMSSYKKVDHLIVGGGIIGASIAAELASRGAHVTLIEKNTIGYGCSYGNAGWMTPCFAMPLPMPGMMFKSMKWLLNPEGPLYIKPSLSPLLLEWLTRFLFSMTEAKAQKSIEGLVQLSQESLKIYTELAREYPEINFEQKGLLMVAQSQSGLNAAIDELERVLPLGVSGRKMNGQEIIKFEPSITGQTLGGVYFDGEAHGEPLQIVKAMIAKAKKYGAHIIEHCEYLSHETMNNQVSLVNTTHGLFQVDSLIMATGSWSTELAKKLSLNIPILGGKGYALISEPLPNQPVHPLMLIEKKIAVTPRNGSIRIAGTLELVDQDFSITQRRVNAIVKGAKEYLTLPENFQIRELWRGLRPCTPDGVPLIGSHPQQKNLFLACGHQMLGLQSGSGTGKLIADLVEGKQSQLDSDIYRVDRF